MIHVAKRKHMHVIFTRHMIYESHVGKQQTTKIRKLKTHENLVIPAGKRKHIKVEKSNDMI